jgi:hypothetical protein
VELSRSSTMQTLRRLIESKPSSGACEPRRKTQFYEDCRGAAITDVSSEAVMARRERLNSNTDMDGRPKRPAVGMPHS